jgi:hypothetical protein
MYTIVVRMSIDAARVSDAARHLREDVVAWAKRQPGFVSGQWLISDDHSAGMGVVVFSSEDAASNAAAGPRGYPYDRQRAWNVETVTVYQQVAAA